MGLRLLILGLGAAACTPSTTMLVVTVGLHDGDPAPSALRVSVFGPHQVLASEHRVRQPALPGQLVIGVPDAEERLRVVVAGESNPQTLGAATAQVHTHQRVDLVVLLAA